MHRWRRSSTCCTGPRDGLRCESRSEQGEHACGAGDGRAFLVPRRGVGRPEPSPYTRTALAERGIPTAFATLDPIEVWPRPRGFARPERLEAPAETLPGVGPQITRRLAKLGLRTVGDLLAHRPRRYESAAPEQRIADLFGEDEVAISGEVVRTSVRRPSRRLSIVQARVADESGEITAVWFNQLWLADRLRPGIRVRLRGRLRRNEFAVRSYDLDGGSATADFAPVYPASEELTQRKLREVVAAALGYAGPVLDPLPAALKEHADLPLRADALFALHAPASIDEAERGRKRLAFDELLALQLGLARRAAERAQVTAPGLGAPGKLVGRYVGVLPFRLTEDQERAIAEIDADLERSTPMLRLLQGDVGSGKTVVALYALLRAVEAGRQGALMAPTETLAEQHFLTIEEICRGLGVICALLTSSVPGRERKRAVEASILVGTHALIQEGVDLSGLAVAVVDEQHRFGVEQRQALVGGRSPHVLHMTATPIPRTLALTVYGDLHVSEIAHPPANRKPIITAWVGAERSSEAYKRLRRHLDAGRQAYVVCPLIEETQTSVARAAELQVLVATTVIEVGVDVPNATIMIVQEADRFGLAQLHQLRGRVGRGAEQSFCLLVSRAADELTDDAKQRLQALVDSTDGFELAEKDLELRGEGQLLGTRQSGLSDLRFTRLRADRKLLEQTRQAAAELVDYEGPLDDEVDRFFAGQDVAA
jgi:ATP-dependent DNA helicase RecG